MASLAGKKDNSHVKSIMGTVADRIKETTFHAEIQDSLIEELVSREQKKRSTALAVAYDNILKLENELRRFKPDSVIKDGDGNIMQEGYTPNKFEERKKLQERIEKYDKAFGNALGGDFKDLYDLNNNFKDKAGSGEKSASNADTSST